MATGLFTLLSLLFLFYSVEGECFGNIVFQMIPFKDNLCLNPTNFFSNLSVEKCGEKCTETERCASFSYNIKTRYTECFVFLNRLWTGKNYTYSSGLVSYWRLEETCPLTYTLDLTTSSCYKLYTKRKTWGNSLYGCVVDGGILFQGNTAERTSLIYHIYQTSGLFLGGNKNVTERKWKWMDGSEYFDWASDEPRNGHNENCIGIKTTNHEDSHIVTLACTGRESFLCEVPLTKRIK